jgi:hypothetical protein
VVAGRSTRSLEGSVTRRRFIKTAVALAAIHLVVALGSNDA